MRLVLILQTLALFFAMCSWGGDVKGDAKKGKKLFSDRSCTTCHALGAAGSATAGPNLAGVAKRQTLAWIKTWISNPDKMRTDPSVVKLGKQYPTPMPNMGLSEAEVDDLVAYLKGV